MITDIYNGSCEYSKARMTSWTGVAGEMTNTHENSRVKVTFYNVYGIETVPNGITILNRNTKKNTFLRECIKTI